MSIDPVVSPVSQLMTQPTTPASSTTPNSAMGQDSFLKLLVAQLQYQDPSHPVDSAQFMSQTAQFSELQKIEDLSSKIGELVSAQQMVGATNLIGRQVTFTGADGQAAKGTVSAVQLGSAGPVLTVGSQQVTLSSVKEVSAPTS